MIADDLPLSRALVDRAAHLRGDGAALRQSLDDGAARVLLVHDGAVVVAADGALALLDPATATTVAPDSPTPTAADSWLLLGRDADGSTYVARRFPGPPDAPATGSASDVLVHGALAPIRAAQLPGGLRWASLREVGVDLSATDAGLATAAVALDAWHARHPHCPRCGAATGVTQAGWARLCPQDGSEHYPRTDPAVIMAVVDDEDRLLLGQSAAWAQDRWSTLAGFVEAGESLEHAVRREVLEETAVVVDRVEYRASQPWPFPASLMLGFWAHARTTEVTVDGVELRAARWFTRAELSAAMASGEVRPPGRASIARALVEEWFGGSMPG